MLWPMVMAQWATRVHRQDLHLWLPAVKWREATNCKSCWSGCKLTDLQCSTRALCRKWAHYCKSTPPPTSPPTTSPNPLPTTCAVVSCEPPNRPPTLPPTPSSSRHKLLYSCTSSPNHTPNTLCRFTLRCFNVSEDMTWFAANCLPVYAGSVRPH